MELVNYNLDNRVVGYGPSELIGKKSRYQPSNKRPRVQCSHQVVGHVKRHIVTETVNRKIVERKEHAPEDKEHGRHEKGIPRVHESILEVLLADLRLLRW